MSLADVAQLGAWVFASLKVLDCHEGQGGQPAVRQGLDTPARPTGGIRGEAAQGADQELEGGWKGAGRGASQGAGS
jgi:hypothetical protein